MKIGIFTDTYVPQINGVVTSIQSSIEYLQKNHDVYVFCPNVKPKQSSTQYVWRFPSVVYPFQKEYRLVLPFQYQLKKFKALALDVIHIHTPFTMGNIGLKIGRKLGVPIVHTYHTYFEKYLHYFPILPEKWVGQYAKKESERFCNACDNVIVPTNEIKQLLDSYNIKHQLITLPSGINPYQPSIDEVQVFKNTYMNQTKTNCLFVGRVGVEKNVYFLIESFHLILQSNPNVHLTIIGDGPERQHIEKKVKGFGLLDAVTFTGYLQKDDVFKAYHAADLMLFPSKTETQGLTAVESMMCGTPVIGLNYMGIKDVVNHLVTGILTEEDVVKYSEAALDLIQNSDKRNAFALASKDVGNRYSYIETGKQLESIYLSMKRTPHN